RRINARLDGISRFLHALLYKPSRNNLIIPTVPFKVCLSGSTLPYKCTLTFFTHIYIAARRFSRIAAFNRRAIRQGPPTPNALGIPTSSAIKGKS
ncbi:hypothetical protein, partial [Burkholderia glumae]|uniref:hypothetical protein n=1 Tax=Burkholderia glumae TaxID=337 RepID=UPI0019D6F42B